MQSIFCIDNVSINHLRISKLIFTALDKLIALIIILIMLNNDNYRHIYKCE